MFNVFSFCAKRSRRNLRTRLRARRRMLASGAPLEHLRILLDGVLRKPLGLPQGASRGFLPKYIEPELDICLRQHLTTNFLQSGSHADFVGFIHGTHPSITLPLPPALRTAATAEGIRVRTLMSKWIWVATQFRYLWRGIRSALGFVRANLQNGLGTPTEGQSYVVFVTVSKRGLPEKIDPNRNSWDLINWYYRSKLHDGAVDEVWFNLTGTEPDFPYDDRIRLVSHPLTKLSAWLLAYFTLEAVYLCLFAFLSLLAGRWWAPLALRDAIGVSYAKCISPGRRAKDYFFHSSILSLRPLWTYEMERTGSRVTCIMYSHHFPIINPGLPNAQIYNPVLAHLSWGRYAVWDADQRKDILDLGGRDGDFIEVGPIGVVDETSARPELPQNAIAVFDVNPIRPSIEVKHGLVRPYFTVSNMLAFLDHACGEIRSAGGVPVLKTKGEIGHTYFQAHRFIEIAKKHGCVILDSGVSPFWLVENVRAVISCPFTSIPSIGKLFGTPSCYFDPTGQLAGFERSAHGNDLIIGRSALREWLAHHMTDDRQQVRF